MCVPEYIFFCGHYTFDGLTSKIYSDSLDTRVHNFACCVMSMTCWYEFCCFFPSVALNYHLLILRVFSSLVFIHSMFVRNFNIRDLEAVSLNGMIRCQRQRQQVSRGKLLFYSLEQEIVWKCFPGSWGICKRTYDIMPLFSSCLMGKLLCINEKKKKSERLVAMTHNKFEEI